jgi:hypothetical protein
MVTRSDSGLSLKTVNSQINYPRYWYVVVWNHLPKDGGDVRTVRVRVLTKDSYV